MKKIKYELFNEEEFNVYYDSQEFPAYENKQTIIKNAESDYGYPVMILIKNNINILTIYPGHSDYSISFNKYQKVYLNFEKMEYRIINIFKNTSKIW